MFNFTEMSKEELDLYLKELEAKLKKFILEMKYNKDLHKTSVLIDEVKKEIKRRNSNG
jgi:hypothetical protein